MRNQYRDSMRCVILELLNEGKICWTDLKKQVLGSCQPFATDSTFVHQVKYLESERYVDKLGKRGSRAPYVITEKGKQLLGILKS